MGAKPCGHRNPAETPPPPEVALLVAEHREADGRQVARDRGPPEVIGARHAIGGEISTLEPPRGRLLTFTPGPALGVSTSTDVVAPTHKLRCAAAQVDPGGGGVNVARVATRLGADALAVAPIGGWTGARLAELIRAEGVAFHPVDIAAVTREDISVVARHTNDHYRFVLPASPLTTEELDRCVSAVIEEARAAACVVLSGSLPDGCDPTLYRTVAQRVLHPVIVDTSGRTVRLAEGADAVCIFVNDVADSTVLHGLHDLGVRAVALRCAGFNNVDVAAAAAMGIDVVRVPAYSPNAVAEHTIALVLSLNRHIHKAYNRVRDGNFALDGLVGFDLAGKTAGVIGTGKIGALVARLLWHFHCDVLAHDVVDNPKVTELGMSYVTLDELLGRSDVISLNCPLTPQTHQLVSAASIARMKPGVMIVNTGRGGLIDTAAAIDGLKRGQIGSLALDVYEEEAELFFEDRSAEVLTDDVFARLLTFPNVLITAHQAFLTSDALAAIADTTLTNLADIGAGHPCANSLTAG